MPLLRRITNLFRGAALDREIDAELQAHIAMRADDNVAAGMALKDAQRDALLRFGNPVVTRERVTGMDAALMLQSIAADLRFACRQLLKSPSFTLTAMLVLSLGFAASIAIYSVVDAALVKPLPYRDPAQLMAVYETAPQCPHCNISYLDFLDWRKGDTSFSSLEAWGYGNYKLKTSEGTELVPGVRVTDGFFRTLGVLPVLGRDFYAGEDKPGAAATVLMNYATWQSRFGGDPMVVGRQVTLSDASYTVIGVLPQSFAFAPRGVAEFWTTLRDRNSCEQRRACHGLFGIARLKDGVTRQAAVASIAAMTKQLAKQYPDSNLDEGSAVIPLSEAIVGDIRPILLMLQGGSCLLLLIAYVNAASLLLVRSESRRREMAVRSALGATWLRLARQFLTEGMVLVAAAGVLGLALAYCTMRLLPALVPRNVFAAMPYLQHLGLNDRVLAFGSVLMLVAVLLFALTPALLLRRASGRAELSDGDRSSAGTLWRRLGAHLVVVELAVAMVLLVGAGLLGKSLYRLLQVDLGMQPDHLATMMVSTSRAYAEDAQEMALEQEVLRRLSALPGVKSAALSNDLPVRSWDLNTRIRVVGRPWNGERNEVPERDVSPGYFATLGARLVRGRQFTDAENDPAKPHVAIVNQSFVRQYFPNENPIGRRIAYVLSKDTIEIVGIVEDIKEGELDSANRASIYLPFNQNMWAGFEVLVRTSPGEQDVLPTMTATIHQIDAGLATSETAMMKDLVNDSQAAYLHRASAWLVGGFATLALILGVVGIYGVISYSVSQRTREIGVRMALGAQRGLVYRLILGEAGRLVVVGVVTGLGCSLASMALTRKFLFGIEPWDAATLCGVSLMLAVCAITASFVPAKRAASINPVEALRAD